ncbi:MAG: sigma-70 family RNA polymerase sigma factor [Firmicutes bacterium]|nr:sigma-70 family RNA polymerase sigma factor [Bacillota bacterium]
MPDAADDAAPHAVAPADAAFESLFRREWGRVVALAQRVLGERAAAEDVAQEVFWAALRRGVARLPRPSAWLHTASVHTALNVLRTEDRRRRREARAHGALGRDPTPDPVADAERRERVRAVRAALARLPSRQAAILVLRHSGLTYAEIAFALRLRPSSVGTLLRRAEEAFARRYTLHAPE